jgi:hypothetical protein
MTRSMLPRLEPAAGVRPNGHVATYATTSVDRLILDRVAHEREMMPPRLGMISAAHLQRLEAEGDAAAAKGRAALETWMDGLTGDEIAALTVKMNVRWRAIARGLR